MLYFVVTKKTDFNSNNTPQRMLIKYAPKTDKISYFCDDIT